MISHRCDDIGSDLSLLTFNGPLGRRVSVLLTTSRQRYNGMILISSELGHLINMHMLKEELLNGTLAGSF